VTRWHPDLVDLTRPLTQETVWALLGNLADGDPVPYFRDISVDVVSDLGHATATACVLRIPDHAGTHVDAPVHMVPGGAWLEDLDPALLIGEAVVLDLVPDDPDHGYTAGELAAAAPAVERGDIVLVHSGFSGAGPGSELHQTYLTPEAAEWLVKRGAKAVGVEPASVDHVRRGYREHGWGEKRAHEPRPWPAHRTLLEHGIPIVEGLLDLHRIAGERVRFAALPALIPGLSGCPVRAVAWREPPPDQR
jgi:kynurenine formamidase